MRALKASTRHQIMICWVSGHCNVTGNENADNLAGKGAEMGLQDQVEFNIPLGKLFTSLENEITDLTNNSWESRNDCIRRSNNKQTTDFLKLWKQEIRILRGVLTAHCKIGYMTPKCNRNNPNMCRSCEDEHELGTI